VTCHASRVGRRPDSPAAYRRGRAWEPSQGSHARRPNSCGT
jgi:hypothetical protein